MNADFDMDRPAAAEKRSEPPAGIESGQSFEEMLITAAADTEGIKYSEALGMTQEQAMAHDIAPADLQD